MSGDVTDCLFDDAIAEIYKLMERDNFQRYKKTDEFRKLLESVNAYGLKAKGRVCEFVFEHGSVTFPHFPVSALSEFKLISCEAQNETNYG